MVAVSPRQQAMGPTQSLRNRALVCLIVYLGTTYFLTRQEVSGGWKKRMGLDGMFAATRWGRLKQDAFPKELIGTAYDPSTDFRNTKGVIPPFWEDVRDEFAIAPTSTLEEHELGLDGEEFASSEDSEEEEESSDPFAPARSSKHTNDEAMATWGPCYPPSSKSAKIEWPRDITQRLRRSSKVEYPFVDKKFKKDFKDLGGLCRPGFIIIGAGKCGTSSLYHYLIGHPRVLPAKQKQIHYFKYYTYNPMKWYLSHFPSATSFLSSGALMTGEASPGYMPYPDVAHRTAQQLPGPKIIAIGREPLDRSWSSYNYNYVRPALDKLRRGKMAGVPGQKDDEYYRANHLFSFEEMVLAELRVIKECLKPGGSAETLARKKWGRKEWAKGEYERRKTENLPPLVDLDDSCYGDKVSKKVPRKQWAELVDANPQKIIALPNLQLVQSIVGRSLYTLSMEWWYTAFPPEDIYFFCTEDLRKSPAKSMDDLGQFLGLPPFNFTDVVSEGMYNVHGHKGYDKAIPWEKATKEGTGEDSNRTANVPLSAKIRKEYMDFVRPFNERLFELTGRQCNW